jgi:hypothetical protein
MRTPTIKEEVESMLRAWDSGDTIWSIEMGGLGPGYEQAIQVAAVEFTRATKDMEGLKPNDQNSTDRFTKVCNEVLHKHDETLGGLSGAQFGAAKHLAWNWVVTGPAELQARYKKAGKDDRTIQVSNAWPRVEKPV